MEKTDAIMLLAIDDKPDNLTTLSAVVRDALPQTRVLTATNGPAGIELAAAEDPDVILLDIVMPGMDGFEVCRRLKADERIRDIPVVFLTALKTDTASRVKALKAGAEGFLAKPLETAELTAQIRAMTKVKADNRSKRTEKQRLEALVVERTRMAREIESRYRAMFENMASASCVDEIVYKDGRAVDYRILDVNPAYERITGIRRQEAAGALASALYGLGHAPFLDVYGRVAETGKPAEFEAWFEPIQKHLHITVGCPKPGFFSTVFTDITERKRAEEALREQSDFSESLIENAGTIILLLDTQGRIVRFNSYTEDLVGYDLDEVKGMDWFETFIKTEDDNTVKSVFQKTVDDIQTSGTVNPIITKDGRTILVEWNNKTLKDKDGRTVGVLAIGHDITERKQAEDEVHRLNEELEKRVAERTAQLEAANKELEAFSYSVSHDLRAPLRSIDGFSQILLEKYQDKPLDDKGRTYLDRVCKATNHMGLLIDDMLKLSRITRVEFKRRNVNISAMIQAIAEEHQKSNSDRVVDVTVQEGIMVQGDLSLLQIAMENLMGNAWKFTGKEEHPKIEFGTTVSDGETACFIRDNGAGFEMAYAGKLFGAFQRLHTTSEFPGTGIGLTTVQRIIHRHEGRIWAEGEKGKGAVFYFTLP